MRCDEKTAESLINWFQKNKREMPWRTDPTPYHVHVSEIMLQQTRVDTVIPYYNRFIKELPDYKSLSEVSDEKLLKLFEGLGYYSRVRNLKKAAEKLMAEENGEMPRDFEKVLKLPGIGTYTAGAILSIAYGLPYPVVDGNVLRVLSRWFLSEADIKDPKTKADFEKELRMFLLETGTDAGAWNQGLMELGALVCIPNGEPKCAECPMKDRCKAHLFGRTSEIPVKSGEKNRKIVEKTLFIVKNGDRIGVVKNEEKGLLSGMYGYPEMPGLLKKKEAMDAFFASYGVTLREVRALPEGKHIFSHVEWHMNAYYGETDKELPFRFVPIEEMLSEIPMATAYKKWEIGELFGGMKQ